MMFGGAGKKLGVEAANKLADHLPKHMREEAVGSLKDVAVDDVMEDIAGDTVTGALEAAKPYVVEFLEAIDDRVIRISVERKTKLGG